MKITDKILIDNDFVKSTTTNSDTTFTTFTKKYKYYKDNTNDFELSYQKNSKHNFPQLEGFYTLSIGGVIIKSQCNDMDMIKQLFNLLDV